MMTFKTRVITNGKMLSKLAKGSACFMTKIIADDKITSFTKKRWEQKDRSRPQRDQINNSVLLYQGRHLCFYHTITVTWCYKGVHCNRLLDIITVVMT